MGLGGAAPEKEEEEEGEQDCFKKGAAVEVCFEEEGFRGSWYTATVLRPVSKKTNKIYLQFDTLMADDSPNSEPLKEFVDIILVRPLLPREPVRSFRLSDEVDAFHNDGWWEGVVTQVQVPPPASSSASSPPGPATTMYSVFFRSSREQIDFPASDLRLHREWEYGKWVPPPPHQQQQAPPPAPPPPPTKRRRRRHHNSNNLL